MHNRKHGKQLLEKYLVEDRWKTRKEHSYGVGDFAYRVALWINEKCPELSLNAELCGFLGYVHDIGYSVAVMKHEISTQRILENKEQVPHEIARKTMHGQLLEQFGEKDDAILEYTPFGIEGIILNYADASVRAKPMPIAERTSEIEQRIGGSSHITDETKKDVIENMHKAKVRMERYERIVLALTGFSSYTDFLKGHVILPPKYIDAEGKIVFLAGPIQGAGNWQQKAAEYLQSKEPCLNIANPRRDMEIEGDFSEDMYNEQVDWETHHLSRSGENGVVMFWLAKEAKHRCDRAYAQTTRFELAEWKVKHERDDARLVVGIEKGFSGAKYVRRRFSQDCPDVPVCSSLEETCDAVLRLVSEKKS